MGLAAPGTTWPMDQKPSLHGEPPSRRGPQDAAKQEQPGPARGQPVETATPRGSSTPEFGIEILAQRRRVCFNAGVRAGGGSFNAGGAGFNAGGDNSTPEETLISSGIETRVSTPQEAVSMPQELNAAGEHFQRRRKQNRRHLHHKRCPS